MVCPACKSTHIQRIRRKTWMRLIITSRYYECKNCHCKFLRILGLFSLVRALPQQEE